MINCAKHSQSIAVCFSGCSLTTHFEYLLSSRLIRQLFAGCINRKCVCSVGATMEMAVNRLNLPTVPVDISTTPADTVPTTTVPSTTSTTTLSSTLPNITDRNTATLDSISNVESDNNDDDDNDDIDDNDDDDDNSSSVYSRYLHISLDPHLNEHAYFLRAKADLEKRHHEKVTKVSWSMC